MSNEIDPYEKEGRCIQEFEALSESLSTFGEFVDSELSRLLQKFKEDLRLKGGLEYRLKDKLSYLRKALYRSKAYGNPIVDINDKVGTRVVLMTSRDIDEVRELIMNHTSWVPRLDRNYIDEIDKSPDRFVYQSVHIIVAPLASYDVSDDDFPKLTCEIQIRSLLQHAYSEVSHDSTYKGPYRSDNKILRLLSTSMALMEATDEYFCRIFESMLDQERKYRLYLNQLTDMFADLKDGFDREKVDVDLSDMIMTLLPHRNVELEDLRQFVVSHRGELQEALIQKNGLLFNQPIIILIFYYLVNFEAELKKHWPLSNESLKSVFRAFGFAFDSY